MKIPNAIKSLKFLFRPSYWIMISSYSREWDAKLNQLMDEHSFEKGNGFRATLGSYIVWTTNHPYGSFTPYAQGLPEVRPSRLTIERAYRKLMHDTFNSLDK